MDELTWKMLTRRFPRTPSKFAIEECSERAARWKPIRIADRPVIALTFSADGRTLAAAGGGLIPGATAIHVFDVETRTLRRRCHGHRMGIFDLAFDARTGLLASASHDYSVVLWEVDERHDAICLVGDRDTHVSRRCVAFCGTELFVGDGITSLGAGAWLHAVDLASGKADILLTVDEEGRLGVDEMAVLPSSQTIVVTLDDTQEASTPQQVCVVGERGVRRTRWHPAGRIHGLRGLAPDRIVAAVAPVSSANSDGANDELVVFKAWTGVRLASRVIPGARRPPIAVSPDRRDLVVGTNDRLEFYNAVTLKPGRVIELGDGAALSLAWSVSGVVAVGSHHSIRLFSAATGAERLD